MICGRRTEPLSVKTGEVKDVCYRPFCPFWLRTGSQHKEWTVEEPAFSGFPE